MKKHGGTIFGIILILAMIALAFIIGGCSSANRIYEDELYVTKRYAGKFVKFIPEKHCTQIQTDHEIFYLAGHPDINIPINASCYVKYSAESMAGTKFWVLYFTWDGTDDLFLVKQNPYTGEVY